MLGNYHLVQISPGGNDLMTHCAAWKIFLNYGLNFYFDAAALLGARS